MLISVTKKNRKVYFSERVSKLLRNVPFSATHSDEMCNFYIMYFYDSLKYKDAVFGCNRPDIEKTIYPKDTDIPLAVDEANNRKTSSK